VETEQKLADAEAALQQVHLDLETRTAELQRRMEEIKELELDVEAKAQQIEQLDTAMRLLKVNHRLARLTVLDQSRDPETDELYSLVEFTELGPQGDPLGPAKEFRIRGDMVYLDHWVVKFDDKYIEQSDIDRSTSLVLFRRIFGEFQEPRQGFSLDDVGRRPMAYGRGGAVSEFEEKIWSEFWGIANDPEQAAELGIRAAHGEAVSIRLQQVEAIGYCSAPRMGSPLSRKRRPSPHPPVSVAKLLFYRRSSRYSLVTYPKELQIGTTPSVRRRM
jgi:hypothetical protein